MYRKSFASCKAPDMSLFDLSLRHKLPLWGGLLIILTALAITGGNLVQTRESIKKNMLARSEVLGRSLVRLLYSAVSQDDVWRAYEIINFPAQAEARHPSFQLKNFVVLNAANQVFISTDSGLYPLLANLPALGPSFARLQEQLAHNDGRLVVVEDEQILLAIPLVAEGVTLGTLVLVHPADYYRASFDRVVKRTAWTTLIVLLIILPLTWFWGRRMASPLSLLTERMGNLGQKLPAPLPDRIYPHDDELGRLFQVYDQMRRELADKEALERQIVKSDRLAALGRLTAGMAHEINNPLGGLLMAVDTLKRHGQLDPVQAKVLPLLERGLSQIQDIVAALLVEAKAQHRPLTRQDVDDVHTLLAQEAKKRAVEWEWHNDLETSAELPATLVRQVLINLLLNAVQVAGEQGHEHGRVKARIEQSEAGLHIEVVNDGRTIPPELMEHLFEPFTSLNEEGHGLGLWITYQIVQQLHGHIEVASREGWTRFSVELPTGNPL
jgi:signal transduction histidine kinase